MLRKRSLSLAGHTTSLALEPAFWDVLEAIAVESAFKDVNDRYGHQVDDNVLIAVAHCVMANLRPYCGFRRDRPGIPMSSRPCGPI
jgi:predicted DNA-binding ribbon-helix-helix protein